MHFMAVKKSRKRFGLVINIHILKTVHLQQLKGMQSSKVCERGTPFIYLLLTNGTFLSKVVYKRVRVWTSGQSQVLYKTRLSKPRVLRVHCLCL